VLVDEVVLVDPGAEAILVRRRLGHGARDRRRRRDDVAGPPCDDAVDHDHVGRVGRGQESPHHLVGRLAGEDGQDRERGRTSGSDGSVGAMIVGAKSEESHGVDDGGNDGVPVAVDHDGSVVVGRREQAGACSHDTVTAEEDVAAVEVPDERVTGDDEGVAEEKGSGACVAVIDDDVEGARW
jgi:hypothetical protein